MLAIREQSWLFPSDFPLRDMQNTVKCPYIPHPVTPAAEHWLESETDKSLSVKARGISFMIIFKLDKNYCQIKIFFL